MNRKSNWGWLIAWLAASGVVAFLGSMFRPGRWYVALEKPVWTPPGWVFGPVWTILYIAMAIAAWLVTRKVGVFSRAILFYVVQLVCNALWSWIFFGQEQVGWALADILVLLFFLLITTWHFWRVSKPAALLLVPYILWVSYATALNFAIWRMN